MVATALAFFVLRSSFEDFSQTELVAKAILPSGFCPPSDNVFADAVHFLIALDHVENPVREEIDVCVSVGREQLDPPVLA